MGLDSAEGKLRQTKTPGVTRVMKPSAGKAFKVIALLVFLFLFLAVNGWARCYTSSISESYQSSCPVSLTNSCRAQGGVTCSGAANFMCGDDRLVVKVTFVGGCYESIGKYVASCGDGCYAQSGTFYCPNVTICTTQPERDSVECETGGNSWNSSTGNCDTLCNPNDVTWRYQGVFTENNVLRCEVTKLDCHGEVLEQRYVLGSCNDNGFCDGTSSQPDSCESDTLDVNKCKSAGQNGSLCTYICPDGNLHSCNIAWNPGTPSDYQPCPSKMPDACKGPNFTSSSSTLPNPDAHSSDSQGPSSSSSSPLPDPEDCPECQILDDLRQQLDHAKQQRQYNNYVVEDIKDEVSGFGVQFDQITSNTRYMSTQLNTTNGLLEDANTINTHFVNRFESINWDSLKVNMDSIRVSLDSVNISWGDDSMGPFAPYRDLDSLPVWRDTLSALQVTLNEIHASIDTLVQDSSGQNVLALYLPQLKKIADKLEDFYAGMTLPSFLDSLESRLGLDTLTVQESRDVENQLTRLTDSTYIDGNFYCEQHPGSELCMELDSSQLAELLPPDSVDLANFLHEQDSILAAIDSALKDTSVDTLGLSDLAGDSALIREKLDFLFFPNETLEQCFEFRMSTTLNGWAFDLLIDFADIFGWDICDLIRKIVRLVTFILIIMTTVKGYIRAFGGGGSGG